MIPKSTKSNEFAQFQKASSPAKQRIIASSFGEVGTLKTSFWLSAPGPIFLQSLDHGLEGVIENFQGQKDIYVVEYEANTAKITQEEAEDICGKFEEDFEYAIAHARTVVWDKETQVYEIFKYAQFGAPSDAPPNYYSLDQRYRRLINMAKASNINFGLIQGMRDAWAPKVNKKTGAQSAAKTNDRVRRGMREVEELVHINIEHVCTDSEFFINVGKARGPGGRDIQNQTLPAMDFKDFAQLVFPESQESDWR